MIKFWRWIKNQIVQDVPEEVALCEFECHKQQCTEREWQTCARRIAWAAGDARLGKQAPSRWGGAHSGCLTSTGLDGHCH